MTIASSISCYDVAPMSVAPFNGTVMSFQNAAVTSALISVDSDCPKVIGRKLAPFLKMDLNRIHGSLVVRVKWAAVDATSKRADLFKLRVSVFKESEACPAAEHWRTWTRRVPSAMAATALGIALLF